MDIRTLAVILGVIQIAELVIFSLLASVNRAYRGIGWWLLASVMAALGFVFMILRAFPALRLAAVLAQDTLILLAIIAFYVGIMRFLGRREPRGVLAAVFAAFFAVHALFTIGSDDIRARTLALCAAVIVVSLLTAAGLWRHKTRAVRAAANFLGATFLLNGAYFAFRGAGILLGASLSDMYTPSLFNASVLHIGILMSILWTGGLIIMVDQRAGAEVAEAKQHFESIFRTSPDAISVTSLEDGLILDVNQGFTGMTGFSRGELVGRSSIDVHIWPNAAERERFVRELGEKGTVENFEAEFARRDGSRLIGLISATLIVLGGAKRILSVTRDITGRKRDEERIKAVLQEKELLLKEVHHRIKNNMTSLMGLLTLQANAAQNPEAAAAIREAHGRLQSMAVLYDRLYRAENLREMSLRDFLPSLVDEIVAAFPGRTRVRVEASVEPFTVGVEVLSPLGIIVNELVVNSLKHAFAGRETGRISVSAVLRGRRATIAIGDDGSGFAASAVSGSGFGLQLVDMLVRQIGGTLRRESGQGTEYILEFEA